MKLLSLLTLSLIVVGCTTPARPPSLLPRSIESRAEAPPPPPAAIPVPVDAATAAKLAALVAEANAGDADFTKADQSGARAIAVARNAPDGSEAWIDGELVQSVLQVARQRSAAALAEIDALAIARGQLSYSDAGVGGLAEIQSAQSEIERIVSRQTARITELSR